MIFVICLIVRRMTNYYTGVGSRKAPQDILSLMERLAEAYKGMGWILRSGGAQGSDTAFEKGAGDLKEVYKANIYKFVSPVIYDRAKNISKNYHGAWMKCSAYAKALHARNVFQVLGMDLETPSHFLVCWTPDGCRDHYSRTLETGGTGTSISVAWGRGIKVYNLAMCEDRVFFEEYLRSR